MFILSVNIFIYSVQVYPFPNMTAVFAHIQKVKPDDETHADKQLVTNLTIQSLL